MVLLTERGLQSKKKTPKGDTSNNLWGGPHMLGQIGQVVPSQNIREVLLSDGHTIM